MKLYIENCLTCSSKIPLEIQGTLRSDIRNMYGTHFNIECPTCHSVHVYTPATILAEPDTNNALGGGVVGGLVGLLGGPLGLLIGAGIGAAVGNSSDNDDLQKVKRFNSSR